jgi:hypothetical protein
MQMMRAAAAAGTQFTCITGTKVQILTQLAAEALVKPAPSLPPLEVDDIGCQTEGDDSRELLAICAEVCSFCGLAVQLVRSLLALLAQKYKY